MKKTLVALAVTAFAASASATTIYDNEGTKVDFGGSVRVILTKETSKTNSAATVNKHSNLKNAGSRFNISVSHKLSDDLSALGYYETRFGQGSSNSAGWGSIVTNKAYVGLSGFGGHKVTFGKQAVIGDDIGQAGYDKAYDVGSGNIEGGFGILTAESDSAVRYEYTGIQGLTLGANYNFANAKDRTKDHEKAGYGLGAIYTFDVAEGRSLTFAAGYTHDDLKVAGAEKANKDGVYAGIKYDAGSFNVAVDGGRGVQSEDSDKTKLNFVRLGGQFFVTPEVSVYGNYSYGTVKEDDYKNTAHQFMLGSDYKLHKNVVTYVEARVIKQKDTAQNKQTDKAIGVGMRVFW